MDTTVCRFSKLKVLFVCVILAVIISACSSLLFYPYGTLGRNRHYEAQAILCSGVPYYHNWLDDANRFDKVRVLEKDSQGRTLFEYSCTSGYHWEPITIWIICQHTSDGVAYYYEDFAYRMALSSDSTVVPETEIEMLKAQNDWNTPLNLDKSRSVSFPYFPAPSTSKDDVIKALTDYFSLDETWTVEFDDLELYDTGKQVLIARLYSHSGTTSTYQTSYLVLYEHSETDGGHVLDSEPFEEDFNCQSVIHQFKTDHGLK